MTRPNATRIAAVILDHLLQTAERFGPDVRALDVCAHHDPDGVTLARAALAVQAVADDLEAEAADLDSQGHASSARTRRAWAARITAALATA